MKSEDSMQRRTVLTGAAALAAMPALTGLPALASGDTASREFRIWRGKTDIGRHRLAARLTEEGFDITIDIDIAVKFLGITAYRYTMDNREVWRDGRILRVDSRVDDDGSPSFARIVQGETALEVDGSAFSGTAPLESVTSSYFAPEFIERRPWISTQSGRLLSIETQAKGDTTWRVKGDLETYLAYSGGDWTGSEFDAKGETARYETIAASGSIADLWARG
jgi:hypothetical protein